MKQAPKRLSGGAEEDQLLVLPGGRRGAILDGGRRGGAYHVGVVSGVDSDGSVRLISGNWGRRVAEAVVPRGAVIAFVAVR